jgi:hypothetical protein
MIFEDHDHEQLADLMDRLQKEAASEVSLSDAERQQLIDSRLKDEPIQHSNLSYLRCPTRPPALVRFDEKIESVPSFDYETYAQRLNLKFTRKALKSLLKDVSWISSEMPLVFVGLTGLQLAKQFAKKFRSLGFAVEVLSPQVYLPQLQETRLIDADKAHDFEKRFVDCDLLILDCPIQHTSDSEFKDLGTIVGARRKATLFCSVSPISPFDEQMQLMLPEFFHDLALTFDADLLRKKDIKRLAKK